MTFGPVVALSSLDGITGFRLDGIDAFDLSGVPVSGAGDVNGDGIDDLIVGAGGAEPNGSSSGSSYGVFGRCDFAPVTDEGVLEITVTGVNDAPELALPLSDPQTAEDTAVAISGIAVSDVDSAEVTVTLDANAAVTLASLTGLTLTDGTGTQDQTVVFSGTLAAVNAALDGLVYTPTANLNGADAGQIAITVDDGAGGMAQGTVTIDIAAVNDAPVLSGGGTNPVYVEDTAPVAVFSGLSVDPVEAGQTIAGLSLSVTGAVDGAAERLVIGGTEIALVDGAAADLGASGMAAVTGAEDSFTLTLSGASLTPSQAAALIGGIAYRVEGDTPTPGPRAVTLLGVTDSGGGSGGGGLRSTVTVEAVNDAPVAGDDAAALQLPAAGIVIAVLGNDTDAEGDTLRLTGLDTSGLLGTADILLEATGEIRYLPGDAFAGLAPGQTAVETLGYTVSDGRGGTDTGRLSVSVAAPVFVPTPGTGDDDDISVTDTGAPLLIDGMGGEDTVTLPFAWADTRIAAIEGGFRLIPATGAPIEVASIETLMFTDATLALDTGQDPRDVYLLYETFLDRPALPPGLGFWRGKMADGTSIEDVADVFPISPEFTDRFGADLDDEAYVGQLFRNAFDREPAAEGIEHWAGKLGDGSLDRVDVGLAFARSPEMLETFDNAIDDGLLVLL